jgi:HTH-type transcriptional regulator/antitoxin HigA
VVLLKQSCLVIGAQAMTDIRPFMTEGDCFEVLAAIRPLRTEEDYQAALVTIDRLTAGDAEPAEGTRAGDLLELLVMLVEVYEGEHCRIDALDPIEAIKFRMEQAGLTLRDLEPAIGGDGRVSEVLNRRRPLTLPMIRRLNQMFDIPAESLIREYETAE